MILETLGLRKSAAKSEESIGTSGNFSSSRSTNSVASSANHTNGRSTKRYSNNLFGSGRFRDYTYMRSVPSTHSKHTSSRTTTSTDTSPSKRGHYSDSLRPITPEDVPESSSATSTPQEQMSVRSAPLIAPAPYGEPSLLAAERLSKALGPSFRRASLALEEAIREIEEETEDEIVMPRTAPLVRTSPEKLRQLPDTVRDSVIQTYRSV